MGLGGGGRGWKKDNSGLNPVCVPPHVFACASHPLQIMNRHRLMHSAFDNLVALLLKDFRALDDPSIPMPGGGIGGVGGSLGNLARDFMSLTGVGQGPGGWCAQLRCVVHCAALCCAVWCTVLRCAVLCCAVLCCAVLCCAVLCCAVLCCAVLCCAVLCRGLGCAILDMGVGDACAGIPGADADGGTDASGATKQLPLNQEKLKRAWEVSQRTTKDDWDEWMVQFSLELLRESPSPALRSCCTVAQVRGTRARAYLLPHLRLRFVKPGTGLGARQVRCRRAVTWVDVGIGARARVRQSHCVAWWWCNEWDLWAMCCGACRCTARWPGSCSTHPLCRAGASCGRRSRTSWCCAWRRRFSRRTSRPTS